MGPLILLPLVFPLACQKTTEPTEAAVEQADDQVDPEERSAFRVHMSEHFVHGAAAREAVIHGDLKGSAEPFRWLASHTETAAMPDDWVPYLEAMRASAATGAVAPDNAAAAMALGGMAKACGDCHEAMQRLPRATYNPPVIDDPADLRGHQYAADFLWTALVENSPDGWATGAALMASAPLTKGDPTPEMDEAAVRLNALGTKAVATTTRDAQATIVGQMIGTCAACHGA